MTHQTQPRLRVLHSVRLRGFSADDAVARAADLNPPTALAELESLAADGLVTKREGRLSGWTVTGAGRVAEAAALAKELEETGGRAAVDDAYRRFLAVNTDMLMCCTRWQVRTVDGNDVLNDHADADYDRAVFAALEHVDDAVQPVCRDLADLFARFASYGPRLRAARDKVLSGDTDWLTKPLIDSYHTVWFELHEDLLSTLGIERAKEATG